MSTAPNRGQRKCATCAFYTDQEDYWKRDCAKWAAEPNPDCRCQLEGKEPSRDCPDFKYRTYLDTSNHGDIGGHPTGMCEWKSPPILRKLLWGQWNYRLVNKDGSWCHCWTPIKEVVGLTESQQNVIEQQTPIKRIGN